jgi:hypothetical protein
VSAAPEGTLDTSFDFGLNVAPGEQTQWETTLAFYRRLFEGLTDGSDDSLIRLCKQTFSRSFSEQMSEIKTQYKPEQLGRPFFVAARRPVDPFVAAKRRASDARIESGKPPKVPYQVSHQTSG